MEEERASLEKVVQRIDQLLNILEMIAGDLKEISQSLKILSRQASLTIETPAPIAPAPTPTPTPTPVPAAPKMAAPVPLPSRQGKPRTIEDVKALFPDELGNMLRFEERNGDVAIKPRHYLGSENFAKIAAIVRNAGGEYISAGKESHFRVPK